MTLRKHGSLTWEVWCGARPCMPHVQMALGHNLGQGLTCTWKTRCLLWITTLCFALWIALRETWIHRAVRTCCFYPFAASSISKQIWHNSRGHRARLLYSPGWRIPEHDVDLWQRWLNLKLLPAQNGRESHKFKVLSTSLSSQCWKSKPLGDIISSEVFFKINLNIFGDALILKIFF